MSITNSDVIYTFMINNINLKYNINLSFYIKDKFVIVFSYIYNFHIIYKKMYYFEQIYQLFVSTIGQRNPTKLFFFTKEKGKKKRVFCSVSHFDASN